MKSHTLSLLFLSVLLATTSLCFATSRTTTKTQNPNTNPNPSQSSNPGTSIPGFDGFNIPGFGNGNPFNQPGFAGGWGGGYGGPGGGHSYGGVVVPSVVCSDKGPCYKKRVTCPKKCFSSYSHSGKNYGSGGGGGGCTIDCKKRCTAYC
ncbi:Glycine-rich protein [Rhynchospora pubera]|uniref:Glycine-rich protein n=1 Tax=Rhynchospora pubera TaxID=906938 RepID=A0AAV8FBB6_9POAL|nr:Glycine-rich protein [Rhynchospora pubera]KAJ4781135.1 Glycine-rich protein [Rhynchospora pubera]KAJ4788073.1 Glycine-rich protein [Rhynchospora pubera]KAJ4804375.1 Glycine-rich protein [Rhynchospora pubera]